MHIGYDIDYRQDVDMDTTDAEMYITDADMEGCRYRHGYGYGFKNKI